MFTSPLTALHIRNSNLFLKIQVLLYFYNRSKTINLKDINKAASSKTRRFSFSNNEGDTIKRRSKKRQHQCQWFKQGSCQISSYFSQLIWKTLSSKLITRRVQKDDISITSTLQTVYQVNSS